MTTQIKGNADFGEAMDRLMQDPVAVSILLELGRTPMPQKYNRLKLKTTKDEDTFNRSLNTLYDSGFIKFITNKNDQLFDVIEQDIKLTYRGLFFLEKIKAAFPELKTKFRFYF